MPHSLHLPYRPRIFSRNVRLYELIWREWVEERLAEGVPRQHLHDLMFDHWQTLHPADPTGEYEGLHLVWNELAVEMVDRNASGAWHEERSQIDEAIELYEANVRDACDDSEPYERLRVIYAEREDWCNVVRVCQAAAEAVLDEQEVR